MKRTRIAIVTLTLTVVWEAPLRPASAEDNLAGPRSAMADALVEDRRILRVQKVREARRLQFDAVVKTAASDYGVREDLVHAMIWVESAYDAKAVSSKGAAGLMQLMPGTAERFGVTDRFDPSQNVAAGVAYLRELEKRFPGNLDLVLAAYNAGEGAVEEHGNRVPPYPETKEFVRRVRAAMSGSGPRCWSWQGQQLESSWGQLCETRTPRAFNVPVATGSAGRQRQ